MKKFIEFLAFSILAFGIYNAATVFAGISPINCVQSVTAGTGVTVSGQTNPTVSLSAMDSQAETFTSSITVNSNLQVGGYVQVLSSTTVGLSQTTPSAVGQLYYCSNCTSLRVCVSTGTTLGAFSSPVSATTACN